jgi:hypothetical protein
LLDLVRFVALRRHRLRHGRPGAAR